MSAPADSLTRQEFLATVLFAAATAGLPGVAAAAGGAKAQEQLQPREQGPSLTVEDLKTAQKLWGLSFTDPQLEAILGAVRNGSRNYESLRGLPISYQIEPPTVFRPTGRMPRGSGASLRPTPVRGLKLPQKEEDVAFLSVRELAFLIRSKRISSRELTKLFLSRMKAYGEKLLCLVSLTEERALAAAKQADEELARGRYRGPLHGVPCGIKDLFATRGYPTSWGSEPHKSQRFEYDAAVVEKLESAGAVIVAKLSLGALAQGDVWFKGRTKNPWNREQGSSGSSAGSACATAAGLVPFTIGTETLGSIMSPSHQCRVTGLRPTYGRASRFGAMAVSWTMDKIGPICRNAEDCAIVFAAIQGADPRDPSSVDAPFHWRPNLDLAKLKVGFLIGANDDPKDVSRLEKDDYLRLLVSMGAKPTPVRIDPVPPGVGSVLSVEAAAAFDDFTRGPAIEELKNSSWPNTYRSNRFVPAVEYLQAMRGRTLLMRRFEEQLGELDLLVANERGAHTLFVTNLTGHPQVLVPNGTDEQGRPRSVSFIGRLHGEAVILAAAHRLQLATGFHSKRPDLSGL